MSSLFALGEKLGTIGDNLANTNTAGFRANQVSFEDILFEATNTGSVRLSPDGMKSDFSAEGAIQSSRTATNMAVTGEGLFILGDADATGATYYTRAGEFSFNSEGYLVNPRGYIVQGYQFDAQGAEGTALGDIQLNFTTPAATLWSPDPVPRLVSNPSASTRLTLNTNVDAGSMEHAAAPNGLFGKWDATKAEPMSLSTYELRSSQDIYDDTGATHTIEFFFDKTSTASTWEYLITAPPAGLGAAADEGVLARGTLTYGGDGILAGMTMENYSQAGGGTWTPVATPTSNGYLAFQTSFSGAANIELDLGINNPAGSWQPASRASTQYGYGSYTIFSKADGYGEGDFTNFSINSEGVIRAMFNNGVNSDLFRVGLANSNDPASHFKRIGYSLYQADPESAALIISDTPGNAGLGKIMGGSLETSNVDMAEQFGDLIFTQRAFQANSKSMLAADEMLRTLIALKR